MEIESPNNKFWPIYILTFLFLAKFLYLGFFVTPLWDIPDETGHFAYVRDIAVGEGIPVLEESKVDSDIMSHAKNTENHRPVPNWIAQHPPLYHSIAALPVYIGLQFSLENETIYKLPRIVSAVSGALTLVVLYNIGLLLGVSRNKSLLVAGSMGFIPMFSHLSSGVNHDTTVFLFSALSTYFFIRFVFYQRLSLAYITAACLALAGAVKMTTWVIIAPFLFFLLLEIPGPGKPWFKHAVGLVSLSLSLPLIWMARNIYYFRDPFKMAGGNPRLESPLNEGFIEFFQKMPVVEHFFDNFYGLIGWIGTGEGQLNWFQVYGIPRLGFSFLTLVFSSIIFYYVLVVLLRPNYSPSGPGARRNIVQWIVFKGRKYRDSYSIRNVVLALSAFFAINFYAASFSGQLGTDIRLWSVVLILFSAVFSFWLIFAASTDKQRLVFYFLSTFLFFCLVIAWRVYNGYLNDGRLRATHGRYFYPVLPGLFAVFFISIDRLKTSIFILGLCAFALAYFEFKAYLSQILPFYGEI